MRRILFVPAFALILSGCAVPSPELRPAATARQVPALEAGARADADNLTVIAEGGQWPGEEQIAREVTPIRVTIANRGAETIRLRYDDFLLIGSSGRAYRALPPHRIEGTVSRVSTRPHLLDPGPGHEGRQVAAPYMRPYPGITRHERPFDDWYYDSHPQTSAWGVDELPTPSMIALALIEGVLEPGDQITGYLYFEKIDDDEVRVAFRAQLRKPKDGAPVTRLEVPFVTQ